MGRVGLLAASSDFVDRTVSVVRLVSDNPNLVARTMIAHNTLTTRMVSEIARRTGADPDRGLYPRLVYHAGSSVASATLELFAASPTSVVYAESLVRNGFIQLQAGLSGPDEGSEPTP